MKKTSLLVIAALTVVLTLAFTYRSADLRDGFVVGTPEIKSISALAFGPDGILFVGDSKSATVFAVDTKDVGKIDKSAAIDMKGVDEKIAALLGTETKNIAFQDMVVNPISKRIYFAIQSGDGTPVLLTLDGDKIQPVSLKDVAYSSVSITSAPAEDAKDKRGRSLRALSISDIGFADGKLLVSGLSNQEFSSTFRSIPFPFTKKQDEASLEIYHAAHGQYETNSPIRTFTTGTISGKKYLIASYTCTPLVLFPMDELKPGTHVKGRTIAEMGSGNVPMDMITVSKGDQPFLYMSNSDRPIFKVDFKNIETFQGSLTTPVKVNFATEGVPFLSMPITNVLQLDKLDDNRIVMLQREMDGSLVLWSSDKYSWLMD